MYDVKNLFTTFCIITFSFISCTKEQGATDKQLIGQWKWTVQHLGSPVYTTTPQNTGIQETLIFSNDNTWSLLRNNILANSGTFKTASEINSRGEKVNKIHYYRNQGADSVDYYKIYNDTTLRFSYDFSGSIGAGARYYVKRK